MELKQLCEETINLFSITDISELGQALFRCVRENDMEKYEKFHVLVEDLSVDWLQMIYQYYQADRKEKKQDYTPKTLADFVGRLAGDADTIIDLCAGSGALTIQKWNRNHNSKFLLYEFDENVIPYLLFNLAIRNINAIVYHADVLQDEIFYIYRIQQGDKYGIVEEMANA